MGTSTADGLCFSARTADWLARYLTPHERLQSGIDAILHVLDWLPVRLVGVVYALIGHGERRCQRGLPPLQTAIPRSIRS